MSLLADELASLRPRLEYRADPARAAPMARYMRDQFTFLGIAMPDVRLVAAPLIAAGRHASSDQLLDVADRLWAEPEREFQYVGVAVVRRWCATLASGDLARVERLLRAKPWWDTVDTVAAHVVGTLVTADSQLVATMDLWIADDDRWIARAAILHQLTYGAHTDVDRLFGYVDQRCEDADFFIRKACGWALRQYARTAPNAVRAFVRDRGERLSVLTRREAMKHL